MIPLSLWKVSYISPQCIRSTLHHFDEFSRAFPREPLHYAPSYKGHITAHPFPNLSARMAGTNYPAKFYHRHPRGYYFPRNIELCFYPAPYHPLHHLLLHPPSFLSVSRSRSSSATPSIVVGTLSEEVFEKPTGKLKVRRVTRSRWQPPFFPILLPILTPNPPPPPSLM